ncbi:hypothetical protein Hdeb2414_s0017g00509681 [Helianthus debilis subsp. tardiflorus]
MGFFVCIKNKIFSFLFFEILRLSSFLRSKSSFIVSFIQFGSLFGWVFKIQMMSALLKISNKVSAMAEGGSRYCSKKSDDICADICYEVYCGGVESGG